MTCLRLKSEGVPDGFVCGLHPIYVYDGYLFEVHSYCGPTPLRRSDMGPRTSMPFGFWDMWDKFSQLSDEEKAEYRYREAS